MTHYDIYKALGLDRSMDCDSLSRELDRQINVTDPAAAHAQELRAARAVLGNPYRRGLYDRQLADAAAPPITVRAVSELAELPSRYGTGGSTPVSAAAQASTDTSPRVSHNTKSLWIGVGAVAVVAAAVVGGFAVGSRGEDTSAAEPPSVSSVVTEDSGTPGQEAAAANSPSPTAAPTQDENPRQVLASGVKVPTGEWLDDSGFSGDGVSGPQCERQAEEWVFAASNGTDRVIICQVPSGNMYYYSYYNGSHGERPVDIHKSGTGKYYTTGKDYITDKTSSVVFEVTASGLRIINPTTYEEKPGRSFTWSCDRTDPSCEFYDSSL